MRRAPFVAGATALGLVGVVTYQNQRPASSLAVGAAAKPPPSTQPAAGAGAPSTTAPSGTGAPSTTAPSGTGAPSTAPTTTAPATTTRTAIGPAEQYGYGSLAVQVTATGSRITDVTVQNLQTAEQYSQQLAAAVIPMLRSQVLKAQSANINGVTGATYTSQAYALSLQAALSKLRIP